MGNETQGLAEVLLNYAPYFLAGAGLVGLFMTFLRYLLKARQEEGDFAEAVDKGARTFGFLCVIAVLAGGGTAAVRHFVASNPGQAGIEASASGQMTPSNGWWQPSGIVSSSAAGGGSGGGSWGGTDYSQDVGEGLREQAQAARGEGDEARAENIESTLDRMERNNQMVEAAGQGLKITPFGWTSSGIIDLTVDLMQNGNAANAQVDADHNATEHGPLVEEAKKMAWCR